jgi:hypothetical protein
MIPAMAAWSHTPDTHTASESARGGALRQRHIAHERRASGARLSTRAKRNWAVRKVRSGPQQEDYAQAPFSNFSFYFLYSFPLL